MASRNGIGSTYLYSELFYSGQKLHKHFCSLRVRGTSLVTSSYIGELCNGLKFNCESGPFIVLILILRRVLS